MNVRSKYDTDEPEKVKTESMRGMCGLPYEMFDGPARVDVSNVKAPKLFQRLFQLLGWKTKSSNSEN